MHVAELWRYPVKSLAGERLTEVEVTPDGFVGDRLVRDVLSGGDPQAAMVAEQLRGLLPPEDLGSAMLTEIVQRVRPLVAGLS